MNMEHYGDYEKGRCCKMGTTAILLCQYRHPTINIDFSVECTWAYHAIFLFRPKGLMFFFLCSKNQNKLGKQALIRMDGFGFVPMPTKYIANRTTDPRVECSYESNLMRSLQNKKQILVKFHLQNLDQAST